MVRSDIEYDVYTTEDLLGMSKEDAIQGLNESQQRFCEYYVQNYNVKTSMVKAGYKPDQSSCLGYKLRRNPKCQRYIQWLKARILQGTLVRGTDIIDQWVKIAFADMTDFVDITAHSVRLKRSEDIDGQLVKTIKSGRDGISIELYDKLKALDSLAKYSADMPKDYKQILEERRQELMEQEFAMKKKLYDIGNPETENDGFLDAIKASAKSVWSEE